MDIYVSVRKMVSATANWIGRISRSSMDLAETFLMYEKHTKFNYSCEHCFSWILDRTNKIKHIMPQRERLLTYTSCLKEDHGVATERCHQNLADLAEQHMFLQSRQG